MLDDLIIAKEKAGLYTNDECFKMALTDAISVACKSLGVGADVYFEKVRSKYDVKSDDKPKSKTQSSSKTQGESEFNCSDCGIAVTQGVKEFSSKKYGKSLCQTCQKKQK